MNFNKLARYFTWKLPNSEKINISDFVNMLWNIWIEEEFLKDFLNKFWSVSRDYKELFEKIKSSDEWDNKIMKILDYFELSHSFVEVINFAQYDFSENENEIMKLWSIKNKFLTKYNDILNELENSKNNKFNWNHYEELIEEFLLNSSYFSRWFSNEFKFEIWWQKIDRLLRLNKNILNINNPHLWYVIVEMKYKKDKKWDWDNVSVGEVPQFESYIKIISKYNISKYWIFVCSNTFKQTAIEKFKAILDNENSNDQSFYIWLITWKDIIEFLGNKSNYKNMSFDEFIERSFIKWFK